MFQMMFNCSNMTASASAAAMFSCANNNFAAVIMNAICMAFILFALISVLALLSLILSLIVCNLINILITDNFIRLKVQPIT